MNISKSNEPNENVTKTRPWTEEDKKILIELYPTHSNKELCRFLEKTEGQVRGMKERLKLNSKHHKPLTDIEKTNHYRVLRIEPDILDLEKLSKQ